MTESRSTDERRLRELAPAELAPADRATTQAARVTYPLDYMDRGCLAASSREHGCSNSPTWELRVRGRIDPAACRQAVSDLMQRYPICRSRVRSAGVAREPSLDLEYVPDEDWQVDAVFEHADLMGQSEDVLEGWRARVRARYLDPCERFPFHLTLLRVAPDEARLLFQQHHAIADGRAFFELLADFAAFLNAAIGQERPPEEQLVPVQKRSELEALELDRSTALRWGLAGLGRWCVLGLRDALHPLVPSYQNRSRDYSGANGSVHRTLSDKYLDEWKQLRKSHGLGLTPQLAAAFFLANARWNEELGVPSGRTKISLPAETRPRSGGFQSFANHLSGLLAELPMDAPPDPLAMMRSLHAQLQRQVQSNQPKKRLVFERALTAKIPLADLRKAVFEVPKPSGNLNLSNLIALPFRALGGPGWSAEDLWITTPTIPPYAVMLTVIRYQGRLCFNWNHKTSIVSVPQIERLADLYEVALTEVAAALRLSAP